MRNKNKNRFAHPTRQRLSDAARRSADPPRSVLTILFRWLSVRAAPLATFNVLPQEGQVLGQQHDRCLSHGGGRFVLGHLKGRSHDCHFVMKGPFVHNKAVFVWKRGFLIITVCPLLSYYTVTHCPKEHKRKQMKECYSREIDRERERNARAFELPPQKSSLGPLLSPPWPRWRSCLPPPPLY